MDGSHKATVTFGQVSGGRHNNFDFLRFFFAALVICAHSWAFLYGGTLYAYDPLVRFSRSQIGLGDLAVHGFFLISGFLITRSWLNGRGARDYAAKRALRILPGLAATLLVTMFVIGPLATRLPLSAYLRDAGTYRYFTFMLHPSLHVVDKLPGVFVGNPLAERVNGSLWTIRQEIVCYVVVALLGLGGALRRPGSLLLVFGLAYLLDIRGGAAGLAEGGVHDFFNLLTYFMAGMLFYVYRDRVPYSAPLCAAALALLVIAGVMGHLPLVAPFCLAYALFYVAFQPSIRLHDWARSGDLSYGIYLYAFPIQQLLVARFPHAWNAATLSLAALAICAGVAKLSWHFVEQPFLRRKPRPRAPNAETHAAVQEAVVQERTAGSHPAAPQP